MSELQQSIFTDGEKGMTAAKMNDIIGGSVIQSDFVASKLLTSTVNPADNLSVLTAGASDAKASFSTITGSAASRIPLADATQNGMLRRFGPGDRCGGWDESLCADCLDGGD